MQQISPKKFKIILLFFSFMIILAASPGIYFYKKYTDAKKIIQNPSLLASQETDAILSKIKKIAALPEDEIPSIVTVSEVEKLKDQTFFAKAKNGDKVLIYSKNKKAYLYDPKANKILEVGPLIIPTAVPETPPTIYIPEYTPTPVPTVTVTPSSKPEPSPTPSSKTRKITPKVTAKVTP